MPVSPTPTPAVSDEFLQNGLSRTGSILDLIGLLFILILILVAAFYATRLIGRFSSGQFKHSNFKVIDTYRISPNKFLQIVKVANKYLVISVSKDNVKFITELEESEVFIKDNEAKENMSFKQILEKVRNKSQ